MPQLLIIFLVLAHAAFGQRPLSWLDLKERLEQNNPTLQAGQVEIDQSRAQEVTAYLRPNPEVTTLLDQVDTFTTDPYRPLGYALPALSTTYLHERGHKRELRLESARGATAITVSQQADLKRTLLFTLRNSYIQTLQAKAVLELAQDSLAYYDRLLQVSADRLRAGDIAQVDLDRLKLQRVQFESDVNAAQVNVRTAKIQLLVLLNERTPVEQFDVVGQFDFTEPLTNLEELRRTALESRPDLRAAQQAIDKAKVDARLAVANGTTDPVFGFDVGRNPPIPAYFGFSVSIPLRIFDRNQGEKARTQLDIRREEHLAAASQSQVFGDVDSAWAALNSGLNLLRPYKAQYLKLATQVRETVSFSYQHGGASLLDFLNAQNEYRSVQLNFLNLVGAYMTAANQLNLAVGREVLP